MATACGASQRAAVVWFQRADEASVASDAGSHGRVAAVDPVGHSPGGGAIAGVGHRPAIAVAAFQCGHAPGAVALCVCLGAGASVSPHEI
ncbi:hypothetical protein Q0M68_13665, partial [Staphylococcus aureus]|nr:hypothetical protein [Staphylococcus aureus]